jgi:hypothetical protein
MQTLFARLALLMLLGLGVVAIPTHAADEKIDQAAIAKLIDQMGSGDFDVREKATASLEKIGLPALPALKKAAQSEDVEIRRRSTDLVTKIEKKNEAARILAPKKVHLVYKDTPLPEALADFTKKSGYAISLIDPEGKLNARKVTLDTGMVTFWEAFDKFCEKAGLVESDEIDPAQLIPGPGGRRGGIRIQPVQPPANVLPIKPGEVQPQPAKLRPEPAQKEGEKPAPKEESKPAERQQGEARPAVRPAIAVAQAQVVAQPGAAPVQIIGAPGGVVQVGPGGFGVPFANQPNQIVVGDGKPKTLPTDYTGAIRIKATDKVDFLGPISEKEIGIGLKLTPEPKVQLQQIVGVRVEKAIDDQDQRLMQVVGEVPANPNQPNVPFPVRAVPIRRGGQFWLGGSSQTELVRLQKGAKASKSLKELTGVISAQVLTPPAAAITVDKIMDAAGKTAKGAEGGQIKVNEVTKADNGQITIKFEMEMPANIFPANVVNPFVPMNGPGGFVPVPNVVPVPVPVPLPPQPAKPPQKDEKPGQGFRVQQPAQAQAQVGQAAVQIQIQAQPGVVVVGGPMIANFGNGITLEDEKGNAIQCVGSNQNFRGGRGQNLVREQIMVFQPQKDQAPAKLVFSGSKSVTIDIPFTLKNITLP